MVEFEDSFSERMAQLEQEDLERHQRDKLNNSSYSYHDETPNYVDEFQSKLSELLDMVHQLSSDLKRTTSSIENETALPTMDLQPLSFVDDDASWNYSILESETTDKQLSGEEIVVNELPYSEEMDFNDNKSDETANSDKMHEFAEPVVSESGLHVLSIYCAHRATKWSPVLDSQPIQGNEMSVGLYYDRFYDWKGKLDEVDYIGDEESYIHDFLYGLKRELAVRIWENKWKLHTLDCACHRALIEENMIKNDAHMVLEEMPNSNSMGIGPLDVKLQLDLPTQSNSLPSGKLDQYCKNVALGIILMKKFSFDPGGCPLSELEMYEQTTLIELNEGDVVGGGVLFHVTDVEATFGPLGDTTVNSSNNGSTKAWLEGAELIIEVVLGQNAMKKYDSIMTDEMPPTF